MQFDISIDFEKTIVLLQVQAPQEGMFIIKTLKKLDNNHYPFPPKMELVRKEGQWHYSAEVSRHVPQVIAAIKHYLKHHSNTVTVLPLKSKIQ